MLYTDSGIITPIGGRPVHRLRLLSWFTAALKTRLIQTTWDFLKKFKKLIFWRKRKKSGEKGENSKKI